MVSTTKIAAFMQCQKKALGYLGKTLTADSGTVVNIGGVGTLKDFSEFSYSKVGPRDWNGMYIWRYNQEGTDDEVRRIVSVNTTTSIVTVDGPWINVSDDDYILIGIDPRKVLDTMDDAYSKLLLRKDLVMTVGNFDLDMERSDAAFWDDYLTNITVTKAQALPANKVTGDYSLRILLTVAAGSMLGPPVRCNPGEEWHIVPCLRVLGGGPFTVRAWDTIGAAFFGQAVTYSGAEFAYLKIPGARTPTGCTYWQLYISGTDNGAEAYLDSVSARAMQERRFNLPTDIDETYKLPLIHRQGFNSNITGTTPQFPAPSRFNAGDLVLGTHYQVEPFHTEANPSVLAIEQDIQLRDDVFYLGTRQDRYLYEPWASLTAVTTASPGELLAYLMADISVLLASETKEAVWSIQAQEWAERKGNAAAPRAEVPYTPAREVMSIKI